MSEILTEQRANKAKRTGESKCLLGKHCGTAQLLPNILKYWICSRKARSSVANIKAAAQNKANEQLFDLFEMMRLKSCCRTMSYSAQMGRFCPLASSGTSELRLWCRQFDLALFKIDLLEKKGWNDSPFHFDAQMSGSWVCFQADNFLIFLFFLLVPHRLWTILSLSSQPAWVLFTSNLIKWSIRDKFIIK